MPPFSLRYTTENTNKKPTNMRDVRTVLEVIHPHCSESVDSSASVTTADRHYDLAPTNYDKELDIDSFSKEAYTYLTSNRQRIDEIASGIFRIMTATGSYTSGTAIRLFDNVLATNYHVMEQFSMLYPRAKKHALVSNAPVISHKDARASMNCSTVSDAIQVFDRDNFPSRDNEIDPILGSVAEFELIDFIPMLMKNNVDDRDVGCSNVLFIPSSRTVPPGTPVITLSYPGSELLQDHPPYPQSYKSFLEPFSSFKKKFYGFGKRIVSYGHAIYPYHQMDDLWIEDTCYEPTTDQEYCVISNECVTSGSSGGATLRGDFEIEEATDRNGKIWLLVEFNSLHFGGEFVPCADCLQKPAARKLAAENIENLGDCENCKCDTRRSIAYNYGISVHHQAIVSFYLQTMKPLFETLFGTVPPLLQKYLGCGTDFETLSSVSGI